MISNPVHVQLIKGFIDHPIVAFMSGRLMKVLMSLGDRAAGCMLFSVAEEKMMQREVARRVTLAIRTAFSDLSWVECEGDKVPQLSIYVLEKLLSQIEDSAVRSLIGVQLVTLRDLTRRLENR